MTQEPRTGSPGLFRRNGADDAFSLLLRRGFDLSDVFELRDDLLNHAMPFIDVRNFTPAEHDRHHDFIAVTQETTSPG